MWMCVFPISISYEQMLRNIEHKAPLIKIPSFVVGKSKDQDWDWLKKSNNPCVLHDKDVDR